MSAESNAISKDRLRLAPADRKSLILSEAIDFFAEVGFGGTTRQLADRLGVKQPLIYRYFPSKDHLIHDVISSVCSHCLPVNWRLRLTDQSLPLEDRIADFYKDLLTTAFEPTATRIALFSGLARIGGNRNFVRAIEQELLTEVGGQLRANLGGPSLTDMPLREDEQEVLWLHHGGMCFHGIRTEIYPNPAMLQMNGFIRSSARSLVRSFPGRTT